VENRNHKSTALGRLGRLAGHLLAVLATLLYLLEEWIWEGAKRAMRGLGALPGVRRLESWISTLPPWGAACFFVLPTSLALPVKLVALGLIAHGHLIRGTLVILAAKVGATALFARIYVLTAPALMQVAWFRRLHGIVTRLGQWAHAQLEANPAWQRVRRLARAARVLLRRVARRFRPSRAQ
jgi:hypothetical protein